MILKGRLPEYGWGSLIRYSVGATMFDPARYDPSARETWIQNHKGFDHRLFRAELDSRLPVVKSIPNPIPKIPALMFNQ